MKKRVSIQGFPVDVISYKSALDFVVSAIDNGENVQIVRIKTLQM